MAMQLGIRIAPTLSTRAQDSRVGHLSSRWWPRGSATLQSAACALSAAAAAEAAAGAALALTPRPPIRKILSPNPAAKITCTMTRTAIATPTSPPESTVTITTLKKMTMRRWQCAQPTMKSASWLSLATTAIIAISFATTTTVTVAAAAAVCRASRGQVWRSFVLSR